MQSKQLAQIIGMTEAILSKLKSGNVKGVKLETIDRIYRALDCKPGDLIDYCPD